MSFASNPGPAKPTLNGSVTPPSAVEYAANYLADLRAVSASHADLANWLLAKEIGVKSNTVAIAAGAERVCQKLSGRLSRLVSPAGSQAILSRALHLAQSDYPFLVGVRAGTPTEASFAGLGAHLHDVKPSEARQGLLAVLGTLLDLLVGFIGEDLTLRLVREVWPELPLLEPIQPGISDGQEAAS